ncbi:MAG: endonuclease/exonuclease/phosphatase family protein [Nitrospirota bacterium]|nr:endonuclease/exonuclease/phosphatase family protein [Nitrospirota bacterium]
MNLKIVTWNMDYWKHKKEDRARAWEYLNKYIDPDIALLQEALPPENRYNDENIVFPQVDDKYKWACSIVSRKYVLRQVDFERKFKYSLIAADVDLPSKKFSSDNKELTVVSMYVPIDKWGFSTPNLHIMLSDLTPLLLDKLGEREVIIAGDFNTSPQWEEGGKRWRGLSQEILFRRIKNFGLINCTKKFWGEHRQTYRHSRSQYPWQNDYIFATKGLEDSLKTCYVVDNPEVHKLSDHNPVVIELNI